MVERLVAAAGIAEVAEKILQAGYGFAITASVRVVETGDGVCRLDQAQAFVITEEGSGKCFIYPYKDVKRASNISKSWSSCHVVYDMEGNEIRAGGIGFAQNTCRKNGLIWLYKFLDAQ
jgi:hypothetical protein